MRHTIPKCQRLLRRMQELSQYRMISGQKLRPTCQGNMNHGVPHSQLDSSDLRLELLTLSWALSLNQVDLLFALRLFSGQIRQLIQRIEIGPRRGHDNICIRPMA